MILVAVFIVLFPLLENSQDVKIRNFDYFSASHTNDSISFEFKIFAEKGFYLNKAHVVSENSNYAVNLLDYIIKNNDSVDVVMDEADFPYFATIFLFDKNLYPIKTSPFVHNNYMFCSSNSKFHFYQDDKGMNIKISVCKKLLSSYSRKRLKKSSYIQILIKTFDEDCHLTNFLFSSPVVDFQY